MKKLILNWLFGTDDVKDYMELLRSNIELSKKRIDHNEECKNLINDHLKTLDKAKEELNTIRKLLQICENHEIDVDEEIKQIEL